MRTVLRQGEDIETYLNIRLRQYSSKDVLFCSSGSIGGLRDQHQIGHT